MCKTELLQLCLKWRFKWVLLKIVAKLEVYIMKATLMSGHNIVIILITLLQYSICLKYLCKIKLFWFMCKLVLRCLQIQNYWHNSYFTVWDEYDFFKHSHLHAETDILLPQWNTWRSDFDASFIFQDLSKILWRIQSGEHTLFIFQFYNKITLDWVIQAKHNMNSPWHLCPMAKEVLVP